MEEVHSRLTIYAFKDPGYKKKAGKFIAQVNPENYSKKYEVRYSKKQAPNSSGKSLKYKKTLPQVLTFDILFDCTGALKNPLHSKAEMIETNGVEADLVRFKKLVFSFYGDKHEPRYLKLHWGMLIFRCRLISLDITYKLFDKSGIPLRAVAKATFRGSISDRLRAAAEKKSSPDLTHVRIVKEGDTLPGFCEEIYGDPAYYVEVARANGLAGVSRLDPGTEVFFPPFEKTAS